MIATELLSSGLEGFFDRILGKFPTAWNEWVNKVFPNLSHWKEIPKFWTKNESFILPPEIIIKYQKFEVFFFCLEFFGMLKIWESWQYNKGPLFLNQVHIFLLFAGIFHCSISVNKFHVTIPLERYRQWRSGFETVRRMKAMSQALKLLAFVKSRGIIIIELFLKKWNKLEISTVMR